MDTQFLNAQDTAPTPGAPKNPVRICVEILGGPAKVGRLLGQSTSTVSDWVARGLPEHQAMPLRAAALKQLRADLDRLPDLEQLLRASPRARRSS